MRQQQVSHGTHVARASDYDGPAPVRWQQLHPVELKFQTLLKTGERVGKGDVVVMRMEINVQARESVNLTSG